ncbi:MAG TPA: hypothetical protein VKU62_05715 [Thermoanaerobaculia bacterium]|nr:hypothetical protein [Thermoanaerobaculia bacterium]
MQQHVRILGWLFIVYSAIIDVIALIVFAVLGGAGALSGDRQALMVTGAVGVGIAILLFLISVPGILAGLGLFKYQQWARILALVLAVLHLFSIPLGTALGIYAFWVLLDPQATPLFEARGVAVTTVGK